MDDAHIYISADRRDTDWARALRGQLRSRGLTAWLDAEDLDWGDDLTRIVPAQIEAASVVIVVIPPAGESDWAPAEEIQLALHHRRHVVPLVRPTSADGALPYGLTHLAALRVRDDAPEGAAERIASLHRRGWRSNALPSSGAERRDRVYIAHDAPDEGAAAGLYHALRCRGVEVWCETIDLVPGEDMVQARTAHLDAAALILLLVSRVSRVADASPGWRAALNHPRRGEPPPVPVLLDHATRDDVPRSLRHIVPFACREHDFGGLADEVRRLAARRAGSAHGAEDTAPPADVDVFIACSDPDTPRAVRLRDALGYVGLRAWAAPVDLAPGDDRDARISLHLDAARTVVVFVSAGAASGERDPAVLEAIEQSRRAPDKRVVPVLFDGIREADMPYGLRGLVGIEAWRGGMEDVARRVGRAAMHRPTERAVDVFVAYFGPARDQAVALHGALEARGLRAWCDAAELVPGDAWDRVIPAALEQARVVLILVPPSSGHDGYYARTEIVMAIARVRDRTARLIPILLDGADEERLPYGLRGISPLRLGDLGDAADAIHRVSRAMAPSSDGSEWHEQGTPVASE